jgi:hypothetical protein
MDGRMDGFHGMDMDNFITEMQPPQTVTGMIRDMQIFKKNVYYFISYRPRSSLEHFADLTVLLQHMEGNRD